ncbi:tetratricopeptide repeat containing protein [Rhodotorula toruloides]|uniref:Tetratricopeptide repeat containing protein n=1 Tax=Rhodotorula toruloides TaxID=5286 RepID=A0A511KFF4_RHOTO|nr:tetratricopeptide repeat containing protein [Rhodotorula toruloides]
MAVTTDDLKAKANAAYSKKDWREAVRLFANAVEQEQEGPASAALLAKRSAAYAKLEDYSSALADAERAVEADPTAALAHVHIAEAALKLKDLEKAEKVYEQAGQLATDASARKRYKEALKSVQCGARHEATTQEENADRPSPTAASSTRNPNGHRPPRMHGTRPSIVVTLPSHSDHDCLIRSMTNEGFQHQAEGGIGVALAAWNQCELGLQHLYRAVYMVPAGLHVDLFNPDYCIFSTDLGFHLTPSHNAGDLSTLTKLSKLIEAEADKGDFRKYLTDEKGKPQRIIIALNKRIAVESRQHIRRFVTSLINGRIISAFFCQNAKKHIKQALVNYRLALDVLEEGNRQWAHESQGKGNVFSPTVVRGVKVVLMKAIMRGHSQAKTDEERRDFPLDELEELADSLLEASSSSPAGKPTPASAFRAEEPFRNQQPGVPTIVNLDLARQANDWDDAAASAMPFDWHQKRDILWAGLRILLLSGGSSIKEIRDHAAEAKRVDDFATRFFGPLPAICEPRDFVRLQAQACEQWLRAAGPPYSPESTIKPIPRIFCPPGFDSSTVLTKEFWEAPNMEGEIGLIDATTAH